MKEPSRKRQKLPVRRGPTTRSHSNVLGDLKPDFRPSSDEEDTGLLLDSKDDGYEPLAFVLLKGRKSRAMKRPARIWPEILGIIETQTKGSLFAANKSIYGVDVPRHMAYRAKTLAVEAVLGEHKKQYPRLRDYAQTIMDTNPGSRVIVTTVNPKPTTKIPHPRPRFHAMFFDANGAREGFLNGCKPFIGVDGCFIKLTTGAQILVATGRDGNNNIFPLAFGIVRQEDATNWCWFLHQLKICLGGEVGQFGSYIIMFDRQKGLLNAINQVFPNCHQRFCLRHMYGNFQNAGFRGEDLKKCMDNASYAYNQHKFIIVMNDLKNESDEAWKWLSGIPARYWAMHAFDTNCKTDLVVNNLSEVFNKYILDYRTKPIRTMVDGIK
ncbi:uncharacterized protein [Aegilops tauschii subsp. strangulata]|uniref:uncharacterized protein n=1 Tax=Aegilops tauschii subsp. strangulata TaxID=200361 RepID=UPI003CC8D66A